MKPVSPGHRLYRWLAVVWAAAVVVLSLLPQEEALGAVNDKLDHFAAYTLLSLLLALGWGTPRTVWKLGLGAIVFGVALEGLQTFSPGRMPDVLDAVANAVGVGLGLFAASVILATIRRRARVRRPAD